MSDNLETNTENTETPENQEASGAQTFADFIPEAYREKEYIKTLLNTDNPQEGLFQQFDGLQSKLGQKEFGIPDENSTDEKRNEFFKKMGRPDEASGYTKPEDFDVDEGFFGAMSEIAHGSGVPDEAFQSIVQGYNKYANEALEATKAEQDKTFDALVQQRYGDNAESIYTGAREALESYKSPETFQYLNDLNDKQLLGVVDIVNNMKAKHSNIETNFPNSTMGGATTVESLDSQRGELLTQLNDPTINSMQKMKINEKLGDIRKRKIDILTK